MNIVSIVYTTIFVYDGLSKIIFYYTLTNILEKNIQAISETKKKMLLLQNFCLWF
jgi:hypothetical protein